MTIEAVRRKSTRAAGREARNELPIGEADANIFNCPACARPLGVGTRRCPGCSTRLVLGVRASRAAGFVGAGLIVGLAIGVGVMGVVTLITRPVTAAVVEPAPVDTPSAVGPSNAPVASAAAPLLDPAIPASAISALRQSSLVNQRLIADVAKLELALAADAPSSVEIARALRSLSATAAFGDRIAPMVGDWADAATVSTSLAAFYSAVGATAREGLAYSLTDTGAYVEAGRSMMTVVDALAGLDAETRAIAAAAGIEPSETVASPAP